MEGAPEEIGAAGAAAGMDTAMARRQLRQLEARAAAEEDLMMRVPLSKVRGSNRTTSLSGFVSAHPFYTPLMQRAAQQERFMDALRHAPTAQAQLTDDAWSPGSE